jgi:peptidoglycan hydrolase CwlO-like protein
MSKWGGRSVLKSSKLKSIIALSLVISFLLIILWTSIVIGQTEPPLKEEEEKLAEISKEQREILQSLFTLTQEIEVLESAEKKFAHDIEAAYRELKDLEAGIASEEINYAKNQEALKRFLKIYQKLGPGSYLEIIMDSDSLSTFLRRLNTLRDLTRNAGKLLEVLEESKNKLSLEKLKLSEKLALIQDKQKQSKEALTQKLMLKKDREDYLLSLNEESRFYQEQLTNMKKMTEELKPLLSKAIEEFSDIIEDGGLSADAVKTSVTIFGIKGTLEEKTFNDIISKHTGLSGMEFTFDIDRIQVRIPEKQFELYGKFEIKEENVLSFQPEGGSFYGMPLKLGYIEGLLNDGVLAIDLKPLLGRNVLQYIKLQEGYVELFVKPNLF